MVMITLYAKQKKRHRCTEQTFGLCGRRQEWDVLREKHVYYLGWNRSPAQVGCMRQVLGPGALGWPRGIRWSGRWEGGSGWGVHVTSWLIHFNVWQNPLQCCELISLQLIKINEKKNKGISPPRIPHREESVWEPTILCLVLHRDINSEPLMLAPYYSRGIFRLSQAILLFLWSTQNMYKAAISWWIIVFLQLFLFSSVASL